MGGVVVVGGGVAKEKKQGPFMRPKRRFPKKDWKKTKKQKVFGMTASNGKVLAFFEIDKAFFH